MSSAICFNLDQSKTLLSGYGLNCYSHHLITGRIVNIQKYYYFQSCLCKNLFWGMIAVCVIVRENIPNSLLNVIFSLLNLYQTSPGFYKSAVQVF